MSGRLNKHHWLLLVGNQAISVFLQVHGVRFKRRRLGNLITVALGFARFPLSLSIGTSPILLDSIVLHSLELFKEDVSATTGETDALLSLSRCRTENVMTLDIRRTAATLLRFLDRIIGELDQGSKGEATLLLGSVQSISIDPNRSNCLFSSISVSLQLLAPCPGGAGTPLVQPQEFRLAAPVDGGAVV